jgi:hypothetical protein
MIRSPLHRLRRSPPRCTADRRTEVASGSDRSRLHRCYKFRSHCRGHPHTRVGTLRSRPDTFCMSRIHCRCGRRRLQGKNRSHSGKSNMTPCRCTSRRRILQDRGRNPSSRYMSFRCRCMHHLHNAQDNRPGRCSRSRRDRRYRCRRCCKPRSRADMSSRFLAPPCRCGHRSSPEGIRYNRPCTSSSQSPRSKERRLMPWMNSSSEPYRWSSCMQPARKASARTRE